MKIVYINSLYSPYIGGGAEITLQTLVESMALKHQVVVLTLSPDVGIHEELVNGIKVIRIGYQNIYWHYEKKQPFYKRLYWHLKDRENNSITKIVKEILINESPDVVSIHNLAGFSSSIWKLINSLAIPSVQVLHDFYNLCPKSNMFKNGNSCEKQCLDCKLLRFGNKEKSRALSAVVGISQFILNKHLEIGLFKDVQIKKVIYNTRKIPTKSVRKKLVEEGIVTFGFIGTIAKHKGIEFLLEAFSKIKNPNIKLVIAGKGSESYLNKIENKILTDKRILFLGYSNQEIFYNKIDILIVPSLWNEPLGMVVPEAFSYSIPVIGANSGGIKEMIENNNNGFLFDRNNIDTLIEAMNRFINKPELSLSMGTSALESSKKFTDIVKWRDTYEKVYKELIKRNN
jgi:glycosyltransferase involved in cell wall biosynthesis